MDETPDDFDPRQKRLNDVLGAYLEAADAGWAPAADDFVPRYPDLADELRAYFAIEAQVADLASPSPRMHSSVNGKTRHEQLSTVPSDQVKQRSADSDRQPARVGDCESLEQIKATNMGIVFKAWQNGANRWVALKMIRSGRFASADEERRFRDEAEAAANLDHPNVVPIYTVGDHDGMPYYTMKLFESGSLHDHLDKFIGNPRRAVELLTIVCRAVQYGHQRGILHRDLKPGNILLDAKLQPHVADFGLAKRLFHEAPEDAERANVNGEVGTPTLGPKQHTLASGSQVGVRPDADNTHADAGPHQPGSSVTIDMATRFRTEPFAICGTFGYMPPEQAGTPTGSVTTAADVFGLGAILYQLLTGKTVFVTRPPEEALKQTRACNPPLPSTVNSRIDRRLEAVCMKCLRKNPGERYTSAAALADDLDRWLRGEPPEAWEQPRAYRAWRAVRRYALVATVAAVVSCAIATAIIFYMLDPNRVPRELEREAQTRPVVLIGETGPPRWSRWVFGEGTALKPDAKDEPFSLSTGMFARLELLRKAPGLRYRYSAEIRHDKAPKDPSKVGLYFAHGQTNIGDDRWANYWCDVTFADVGSYSRSHKDLNDPLKTFSQVALTRERYLVKVGFQSFFTSGSTLFTAADQPVWRKLAVQVTQDQVSIYWDGQLIKNVPETELREFSATSPRVQNAKGLLPEFEYSPAGGLGLMVWQGKASYRNVVIELIH